MTVVCGRSVWAIAAQAGVSIVYWQKGNSPLWHAAAPWWSVRPTLVDRGCLALMAWVLRAEGIDLRDLIRRIRWTRDPFVGTVWFLVDFPFFGAAAPLSSWLVRGTHTTEPLSRVADGSRPSIVGDDLQPVSMVDDLVRHRRNHLPGLCLAPAAGSHRARVGWRSNRQFLVGPATQLHSSHPRLALCGLALFAFLPGVMAMTMIYHQTRRLPPLDLGALSHGFLRHADDAEVLGGQSANKRWLLCDLRGFSLRSLR